MDFGADNQEEDWRNGIGARCYGIGYLDVSVWCGVVWKPVTWINSEHLLKMIIVLQELQLVCTVFEGSRLNFRS